MFRIVWRYNLRDPKNEWLSSDYLFSPARGNFRYEFEAMKSPTSSSATVKLDDISANPSDGTDCGKMLILIANNFDEFFFVTPCCLKIDVQRLGEKNNSDTCDTLQ